jgi:hypothetical protein
MAFATLETSGITDSLDTGTSWNVNLPGSMAVGELIILVVGLRSDSAQTIGVPTNWTSFESGGATNTQLRCFWREVDATWSADTTVAVPINDQSAETYASAITLRWSGATDPDGQPPEAESAFSDTATTTPDPPNLVATGSGKDWVWVAGYYHRDSTAASAFPYADNNISTTGNANSKMELCTDDLNSSPQNPGTFTTGSSPWTAFTIVVHPGGGLPSFRGGNRGIMRGVARKVG